MALRQLVYPMSLQNRATYLKPQVMAEEKSLEEMKAELRLAETKRQLEELDMINKIKQHLTSYYHPVNSPLEASFHFSTVEIYEQTQRLFPTSIYSAKDIATWLNAAQFTFWDFGCMKFEWLLKKP